MTQGKNRGSNQVAKDRRLIGSLYLKGWTQRQISREVKISIGTVNSDLKVIQEEWKQSTLVDIDTAKTKELAKLDKLELELWAAWERSIGVNEKAILKGGYDDKRGDYSEASVTETLLAGEPRFLEGVLKCIDKRCKILGIMQDINVNVAQMTFAQFLKIQYRRGE